LNDNNLLYDFDFVVMLYSFDCYYWYYLDWWLMYYSPLKWLWDFDRVFYLLLGSLRVLEDCCCGCYCSYGCCYSTYSYSYCYCYSYSYLYRYYYC